MTDRQMVKIYDTGTYRVVRQLVVDDNAVLSLAWSPDGATLATGSSSQKDFGVVKLWDPNTGKLTASVKPHFRSSYNHLTFSPNGRILALTSSTSSAVGLRSVKTAETKISLPGHAGALTCVVFAPDGRTPAAGLLPGRYAVYNLSADENL